MLRNGVWIAVAIVVAAIAAAAVTGVEAAVVFILPNLGSDGSSPGLALVLTVAVLGFSFLAWLAGLIVLGLPLGLALRRIGRDGYVSAILAGAIGGAVACGVVVGVFGGLQPSQLAIVYPALTLLPGAVAGWVVRRIAYGARTRSTT